DAPRFVRGLSRQFQVRMLNGSEQPQRVKLRLVITPPPEGVKNALPLLAIRLRFLGRLPRLRRAFRFQSCSLCHSCRPIKLYFATESKTGLPPPRASTSQSPLSRALLLFESAAGNAPNPRLAHQRHLTNPGQEDLQDSPRLPMGTL